MLIRHLTPSDAAVFQAMRLFALRETPSTFGSSYEEEVKLPAAAIESRLARKPDGGIWGAFQDNDLIGTLGLARESMLKLSHKANLWGMYVAPQARGHGVARSLLLHVLAFAQSVPALSQINLSVNAANHAAIGLYQSEGFAIFGREPFALMIDGEPQDELHMYLRLTTGHLD